MICQHCGVEAPTKHVAFYQNIGLLVMRMSRTADGYLCKSCIHSTFWQYTLTSMVMGWWGIISLIVNPFFILNNIIRYLLCLGMDPVPPGAVQPELTQEAIGRLGPHTDDLIDRLNAGDDFDNVAQHIATRAGVSTGQVALYLHALIASAEEQ